MTEQARQFPYGSYIPNYINGLGISNDATTPHTLLDVAVGNMLDSSGIFQIALNTAVKINTAVNGLNGLDTGTIAASTLYAVFLIADVVTSNVAGAMLSLSYTAPLMPYGYNAFGLIGYVAIDGSSNILPGYWTDHNVGWRQFMYDAPQATSVTAGAATSYTAVDLVTLVPAINNLPVWINSAYTPNAASDTFKMQPANATGDAVIITGQVATVVVTSQSLVMAQLATTDPKINYKVSSGSDAVAIKVGGYMYRL